MQVLNLLMVMFPTGSFHLKILELGQTKIKYLIVISLLKSVVPVELQSCSLGKPWKLSPPNRIEIWPEWDSWLFPVHAIHWFGIEIENAEVLFSSSSMACRCSFNLFNLSVTSVVWTVDPFPVNGSRLIW